MSVQGCTNVNHNDIDCIHSDLPSALWCENCKLEDEQREPLECLEHNEDCAGKVEYRMALSGTGKPFPRCEYHWEKRLEEQDRINQLYAPDSDCPPEGVSYEEWAED